MYKRNQYIDLNKKIEDDGLKFNNKFCIKKTLSIIYHFNINEKSISKTIITIIIIKKLLKEVLAEKATLYLYPFSSICNLKHI